MPIERYYLTRNDAGRWNVIDRLTGGPVEIGGAILYDLDADDAGDLLELLIRQDQHVLDRLHEITKRRETP